MVRTLAGATDKLCCAGGAGRGGIKEQSKAETCARTQFKEQDGSESNRMSDESPR